MKKYLCIGIFTTIYCIINAQNNTIFFGGIGDGISGISASQVYVDMRVGGAGDGANNNGYVQDYTDVRIGGASDGWSGANYIQNYLDVRKGGIGDGWTAQLAILPLNPLGVEFLSFNGELIDDGHLLLWKTIVEKNTSHFLIEHSANASAYLELGMRTAKGNSTEKSNYTFINKKPILGDNYYRLKLVDNDGKYKYSNVVLLKLLSDNTVISVYPNPTASHINIEVNSVKKNVAIELMVLDMHGKINYKQALSASNASTSIDISSWASGTYFVRIVQGAEINTIKVVKL